MKKTYALLSALLLFSVALRAAEPEMTTEPERLPPQARRFLNDHFPDTRVTVIRIDRESSRNASYDVILENGAGVTFDRKGVWTGVENRYSAFPSTVLPLRISEYLHSRFPDRKVVSIGRGKESYRVEFADGRRVDFDTKGELTAVER